MTPPVEEAAGINRIRLEFKVFCSYLLRCFRIGINRIRLEFKDNTMGFLARNPTWY